MTHLPSNFVFKIDPSDALAYCNFEFLKENFQEGYDITKNLKTINVVPKELKIKQSEKWANKKIDSTTDVKILEKISDWTYITPYKGTTVDAQPQKDIS